MKKNILKKFIVLFSLSFILFGFNIAFASDTVAPSISDFLTPSTYSLLEVPISSFVATDTTNDSGTTPGVTGYLINESPDLPEAGSNTWSTTPQTTYPFSSEGSKTLYAWAKDNAGNISNSVSATVEIDTTIPIVTLFKIQTPSVSLNVLITTFTATDEIGGTGVVGYKITESEVAPLKDDLGWSTTIQTEYTFSSEGSKTLYAWVKDAVGNISLSVNAVIKITLPNNDNSQGGSKNESFSAKGSITLPYNCSIKDLSGGTSEFPQNSSPSTFLGICALSEAKAEGIIDDYKITKYPIGLFVDSINNIKDSNSYWALYLNDIYEESRGLIDLPLVAGDKVSLVYLDFGGKELGPRVDINIGALTSHSSYSNGGSSITNIVSENKIFSIPNALDFLLQNRIDSSFYIDWVAIAAGAGDNRNLKSSIINYLKSNSINSEVVTDYERRAMALMALGINPYNETNVNYIKKIIDSFDGMQIGNNSFYNDDIFGLIVLSKAGYSENDGIISKTVSFVLSKQSSNGSWGSVDMTAAAIEALNNYKSLNDVEGSILKGEVYLKGQQKEDGSFGNTSSTSWAIQALFLNESNSAQVDSGIKYLASKQDADGGLEKDNNIDNRVWITSYTVPAILKLSWNNILKSFPKQEKIVIDNEKNVIQIKLIKKSKIIKDKIYPKLTIKEEPSNNLLIASAAESNQNPNNVFFSMIHKALLKISAPFVWFWTHLFS